MIRDSILQMIVQALDGAKADGSLPDVTLTAPTLERPKQAEHGDYSTNVAMVAAASLRKATGEKVNPRQIAQTIVDHMPASPMVSGVELAGPGFINLRLSPEWLAAMVGTIVQTGPTFGNIDRGQGAHWQVEFVSANPTGPLHFGGARNAVLGSALANVLEAAGYQVQREFYVNDGGTQFQRFLQSLYTFYARHLGREEALPEGGYPGEYMQGYAQQIAEEFGDRLLHMSREEAVQALWAPGRKLVLDEVAQVLAEIGVTYDNWYSEQSLHDGGLVEQAIDYLAQRGDVVERDGAVWFTASKYPKNEQDVVLIRQTGAPTYFASDIAYHYDKFLRRNFAKVVNVWAVDHQGHVPRMDAMMHAFGLDPERLVILMYDLVKLTRDGVEVKLSKRAGELLTLREVLDEVGADPVRYMLLSRSPEAGIEFDLAKDVVRDEDNPVFRIQYAHARICSIFSKAKEADLELPSGDLTALLTQLNSPAELTLIRKLLELEEQIDLAVDKLSPHNLIYFGHDLTGVFSSFYRDCRVVDPENPALSQARLLLCQAARIVFVRTLSLLGMSTPESM